MTRLELADARDRVSAQYMLRLTRLALQRDRLAVLRKVKLAQQDRLKELQRRYRLGQSREPDLLQVEIENSRLDRRIINTKGMIDSLEQELSRLLLLQDWELERLNSLMNPQGINLLIAGLRPRPEFTVAALRLQQESLEQRERSAWLTAMPTLGVYGHKNLVRPTPTANEWEWGLRAQWTFFEGFRTPAHVEAARARRVVVERQLFAAEHQRKNSLQRLGRDMERLDGKQGGIVADIQRADRALRQQERDYRLGIITELEVQQTLQSILDLDLELIDIQESRHALRLQEFLGGEQPL
jgi:outer membrane protein TolC